jgi:hypothetical protein
VPQAQEVYGNGVVAGTGQYGVTVSLDDLYELIQEERKAVAEEEEDYIALQVEGREQQSLGPPPSISPNKLSEARWGIIWPPDPLNAEEKQHQAALQALIAHRRKQMGGKKPHEFYYQKGWTYDDFLWEGMRQVEPGNMVPDSVPYYLCIVGSPKRIPWEFQQYLDGEYAVGRLWFDDPADCSSYVHHVLEYERPESVPATAREVLFFGPENDNDRPTQESTVHLVRPLHDWLASQSQLNFHPSLLLGKEEGAEAFRTHLSRRLKGQSLAGAPQPPPALLFSASHGLEHAKPAGKKEEKEQQDQVQRATQGALLCQEWVRPPAGISLPVEPDEYLAAPGPQEQMKVAGMMAFCFACYSAGTPLKQDWVVPTFHRSPAEIALQPFVARLPQKLLARGLLAFIGHVSKAWEWSFLGTHGRGEHLGSFREPLGELLRGQPVGHATDYLNERWAKLTVLLDRQLANKEKYGKETVVATWKARNDCRGYAILGDPAARLRVESLQP